VGGWVAVCSRREQPQPGSTVVSCHGFALPDTCSTPWEEEEEEEKE